VLPWRRSVVAKVVALFCPGMTIEDNVQRGFASSMPVTRRDDPCAVLVPDQ
jgi:hypothetical protein